MFKFFNVTKNNDYKEIDQEDHIDYDDFEQEEVWQVAIDILETKNEMILLSPIAWVDLDDIDISYNDQVLKISWYRKKPDIFSKDISIKNSECFWGEFSRNIILPENLDFDDIRANLDNNLLVITIPKISFSSKHIRVEKI